MDIAGMPEEVPSGGIGVIEPLAIVQRLAERLAGAVDLEGVAAAVANSVPDVLDASALTFGVLDATGSILLPLVSIGLSPTAVPLASEPLALEPGMPAHTVLATKEPILWSSTEERDRDYPRYALPTRHVSWAVLPLVARRTGVGVLSLGWSEHRTFVSSDVALLNVVAQQCALAIDRAQLLEAERAERARADLLAEGTRLMVSALEPTEIVLRLARLAVPVLAPWCAVYAAAGDHLERVALEVAGDSTLASRLTQFASIRLDMDAPLTRAYRSGQVQIVPEVGQELVRQIYPEDVTKEMLEKTATGHWAAIAVPVRAAGRVVGVMSLVSDSWGGAPSLPVLQTAEGLAGRAGVALTIARRFQQEHETAVALTDALLPSQTGSVPGFEIASRYLPAGGPVAGDWFDVLCFAPGRYLLGVGDAAGHGIEAAALMAELRNAARGLAVAGISPAGILAGLDSLMAETQPDGLATAAYFITGADQERLTWASSGHVPPIVYDADGARLLEPAGAPPLGCASPAPADRELILPPGAGLLLFTDGVIERRGVDMRLRLQELLDVVAAHRGEAPQDLAEHVISALCDCPEDDCCLLVVRRAPSSSRR